MENIFLTEKQAAERYQLSTRTSQNWRKSGKLVEGIKYFYLVRGLRYKPEELQEYC
jgi:hypothetical protein